MICNLCPRKCGVDRKTRNGFCGTGDKIKIARASLHEWEEPCISFKGGSGAVFFSGCSLGCVYCQNKEISRGIAGREVSDERFYEILFELKDKGAENINLVTAAHFIKRILPVLKKAKHDGLDIPIVYNTSSYECAESIKSLDKTVDIYLPDFKYLSPEISKKYSFAEDYPDIAKAALDEMVKQRGACVFDKFGKLMSGVVVRHLVLPGHIGEAKRVVRYLHDKYGDDIYISIMSQYTPLLEKCEYKNLLRRVKKEEYERVVDYAVGIGVKNAYIQDGSAAEESFIPQFDCEGV